MKRSVLLPIIAVAIGCSQPLRITSTPSGATAEIWPTGDIVTTPGEVRLDPMGTYAVRYRLDGYHEESVQVSHVTAPPPELDNFFTASAYRLVPNPVHISLKRLDGATRYPQILVDMPTDLRSSAAGTPIRGTDWACNDADTIYGAAAADFVRGRLVVELRKSGLFRNVSMETSAPSRLVLRTQLNAFCSYPQGFWSYRIAGLSALRFTVQRDDEVIFEGDFERVVTDEDAEFTGEASGRTRKVEQARRTAMGDSLRGVVEDFVSRFQTDVTGIDALGE